MTIPIMTNFVLSNLLKGIPPRLVDRALSKYLQKEGWTPPKINVEGIREDVLALLENCGRTNLDSSTIADIENMIIKPEDSHCNVTGSTKKDIRNIEDILDSMDYKLFHIQDDIEQLRLESTDRQYGTQHQRQHADKD